jgi:uncharacterized paraquat-inducible protein A
MSNKIVNELRELQQRLQEEYSYLFDHKNNKGGLWIHLRCKNCNKRVDTPFYLNHDGKCPRCNKLFYKKQRKKEE